MLKRSIKVFSLLIISLTLSMQTVFASSSDMEIVKKDIYNHLINWDTEFEISYFGSDIIDVIRDVAAKDDYLSKSLTSLIVKGNSNKAKVIAGYRTTKEQEKCVDDEIKKVVDNIISTDMSDFDKVKAINDYLVHRYDYDNTLQSNNSYLALTTGSTTCQGYSMTAYKMFNMAGIENRIVLGTLNDISHGWNEVKVNGKWYNIDITNNDYLGNYKFFLKSDELLKANGFKWDHDKEYEPCNEDYA